MLDVVSDTENNIEVSVDNRKNIYQILIDLPQNESMFKCHTCKLIFDKDNNTCKKDGNKVDKKSDVVCPNCGTGDVELMCKVDAYSVYLKLSGMKCREQMMIDGTDICPVCKDPICPQCGNHSVLSLSRVTGYMQDISGWNEAKKQELIDRKRYIITKPNVLRPDMLKIKEETLKEEMLEPEILA